MKRFLPKIPVLLIGSCTLLLAKAFGLAVAGAAAPILGNYPNTSLPLSTDTTVLPDAAPTNTTSMNVSTSTNFKGSLEGYPATGIVRVTDAHPAGAYTVTVRAFDSGGASAIKTFMLTVTTPATCTPIRFAATNFAVGSNPLTVLVGDFNGDGKQDLAAVNNSASSVSVLLGDGLGGFSAPTNFAVGFSPFSAAVGDFNGDGKQDLAVACYNSNTVSILLGDGAGGFSAATNFAAGSHPYSVAVGDFNGDGKQDVAVPNYNSGNVSILLGNGAGSFGAATNFVVGSGPFWVAVGDFNGDSKQDLAVANYASNNVSILLGNGAGGFSAATQLAVATGPLCVALGDFNRDGKQDLAVTTYGSNNVSILSGNGAGGFGVPVTFAVGTGPRSVTVGDFNGDGNQDLAVANYSSYNVFILLGDGVGEFGAPTNFAIGSGPFSVAVGDFNGDGWQDLAVGNALSNSVLVLPRVCALTVTSAVSRMTHAFFAPGFSINLPLTGSPGIECRTIGGSNDYTIVVGFSGNVTVTGTPQAQLTLGMGCVGTAGTCSANGAVTVSDNEVTIPLTNVANAQAINVTLNGVSGGIGNVVIPMRVLAGDVNGNGAVNATDVAFVKARIGQGLDSTDFRADINANGSINATDASLVKSNVGTGLP